MGRKIVYRLLTVQDAASYHSIRLECLKNHPNNFGDTFEEEQRINSSRFLSELSQEQNYSFWYGAFDDKQLVGIAGFIQEKRLKTKHRGNLIQVYTSPTHSNQGIGNTLIKLTIEKAFDHPEIEQILLSVVYTNERAISIYKRFGFVEYGLIEDYFKTGEVYSSQLFMTLKRNDRLRLYKSKKEQMFKEFAIKWSELYR
ncbi:MAG: GNAT family N-acetyltransferase [Flavisolibacter sp.]